VRLWSFPTQLSQLTRVFLLSMLTADPAVGDHAALVLRNEPSNTTDSLLPQELAMSYAERVARGDCGSCDC
jgi:hypothetical protein